MNYRIFYHIGETMNLKSKVHTGTLTLTEDCLTIDGNPAIEITYRDFAQPVESHRLHFLCSMLRITHRGGILFATVPFVSLFGVPIITNFPKQNELQRQLDPRIRTAWLPPNSTPANPFKTK